MLLLKINYLFRMTSLYTSRFLLYRLHFSKYMQKVEGSSSAWRPCGVVKQNSFYFIRLCVIVAGLFLLGECISFV